MDNPWPTTEDRRRATEDARGDNAKIAALADQVGRFNRLHQYGLSPSIPPVAHPFDAQGHLVGLDCEVIVNRFRSYRGEMRDGGWRRAKVVGIGDEGLPGRVILRIRPHGSNYLEGCGAGDVEVHDFDAYAWVKAEEKAAKVFMLRNVDLADTLWGHRYFGQFQAEVASQYVAALPTKDGEA